MGGSTIGSVRIPSMTALLRLPAFMIFPAANIPKKKQKKVATTPVFSEIQKGLQSRFSRIFKISLIDLILI